MKKISIIGSGIAGYTAAIEASKQGYEVYLIEKDKLGGTCLNYGCIPTKALITSAEVYNKIKSSQEFGIEVNHSQIDLRKIMERKNRIIKTLKEGLEKKIKSQKIQIIYGEAQIIKEKEIKILSKNGPPLHLKTDYIILATGSKPKPLSNINFDKDFILSSDDLLNIEEIPESVAIIGGGVIGCEFAYILNAFGCKVIILEAQDRLLPLPSIDRDISNALMREMKKKKVQVKLKSRIVDVERIKGNKIKIHYLSNRKEESLICDKVVISIGREPIKIQSWVNLDLDDKGWIKVNEYFKTSIEGIYAIGDAIGPVKPMVAHVAMHEGRVCISNISGNLKKVNYSLVPSVVYTRPEIGAVGFTEEQVKKEKIDYGVKQALFRTLGKAQAAGSLAGEIKVIYEKGSQKILGVHLIGENASELIGMGYLLLEKGGTLSEVKEFILPHPSFTEIFQEIFA